MNKYKVELTCVTCGKKFLAYKHEKNRKNCSKKCFYESKKNRPKRICEYCGKEFYRPMYQLRAQAGKYCSMLCSNRAKDRKWFKTMDRTKEHCEKIAQSRIGEKNPMWKGGVTPENHVIRSSAKYRKWRRTVLQRDGYACVHCGSMDRLEAHHLDLFSKNREARFDPNNGLTLCYNCHKVVHSSDPTPSFINRTEEIKCALPA